MSTPHEKIAAQAEAFRRPGTWRRHLVGPAELEILLNISSENFRLREIIQRASTKFCEDGPDGIIAAAMFRILGEAKKTSHPYE